MITKHSTEIPLTCSAIRNGYTPDLVEHHAAAQALGLDCPLDVFANSSFTTPTAMAAWPRPYDFLTGDQ